MVADDGPGIDSSGLENVFDRFERSQKGSSMVASAGLGLPIARALVALNGGKMGVDSQDQSFGSQYREWWHMRSSLAPYAMTVLAALLVVFGASSITRLPPFCRIRCQRT